MVHITAAHLVGAEEVSQAGYILTPSTLLQRARLWWLYRRGAVLSLGQVDGKPTYLVLRSMLKPKAGK
ncbi:hypothetical protein [Azospirillum sp.]|uniref:hypothetical protein n=1 Tax=Azospirillum sp. TaxID=34012 RepID=UPI003D70E7C0